MAGSMTVNPKVNSLTGKAVMVNLKWGHEYKGFLVATDVYKNLQLASAEEFIDGACTGNLGEVLSRRGSEMRSYPIPKGSLVHPLDLFGLGLFIEGSLSVITIHTLELLDWKGFAAFDLPMSCNAVNLGPGFTHLCDLKHPLAGR